MSKSVDYYERITAALQTAAELSRIETHPEAAVSRITRCAMDAVGDLDAPAKPGALKPGEKQFVTSCIFFKGSGGGHLILFADHGFPAEQRHARISIMDSRPGYTARTGEPVVVPNTDGDHLFRQILKTGRVGCSVYAPVNWQGETIGMFNVAAQARYMYDETDLRMQMHFANLAAATWMALGGPAHILEVSEKLGPWSDPS